MLFVGWKLIHLFKLIWMYFQVLMLVSVLTTAWANEDDQKAEPMEQEPTIQVKVIHLKFNSILNIVVVNCKF